ncbi:MAG: hypothetical protein J6T01_01100 [Kiritimatiellae bacterium]|nr:hypothetical protein [Kiritimatiellia bacterium]
MVKMLTASAAALAAAGAAFGSVQLRELTFQVAMPVKTAPAIDGSLDDAAWKEAVVHDRYYEYIKPNPRRVKLRTDCMIVYDDKGVYTGIRNWEDKPQRLRRNVIKNKAKDIWLDDCAELYYDPAASGSGYYRFVVNANGKYDSAWRMDTANIDWDWNPDGVRAAAKVFDDRWEFELFLPWSVFHNRPMPEPGEIWTFNHSRFRYAEHGWGDFSTSAPGGSVISPNKFGYLYFSDGSKPDAAKVLDLLQKRLQTIWAIEIDGKTYLRDLNGISTMDESVPEFIARRDAAEKAEEAGYETNFQALAKADYKAEPLKLPVAGTYDLNPPEKYDGYNGWYRHNRVKDAYVTPHLDWRAPEWKVKTPKVLFCTGFGAEFRDAIELEQRFDMEAYYFPGNFGETGVYRDPVSLGTHLDKRRQFETLLTKEPDVFVFTGMNFDSVPSRYRYEILRRVRDEGRGLVVLSGHAGKARRLFARLPKDRLAMAMLENRVSWKTVPDCYLFGRGRVVLADIAMPGPWSLGFRGDYETRSLRRWAPVTWAAHNDPCGDVVFADGRLDGKLPYETKFIAFKITGSGEADRVRWRLRDKGAAVVAEGWAKQRGELTEVPLERVAPGGYALDILHKVPVSRTFEKEALVGEFTINGTNEILIAENGPVSVKVEWEKPAAEGCALEWEIYDMPYRQLRDKGSAKLGRGARSAVVKRAAKPFPTLAGFIRARLLLKDGSVAACRDKMAFFPNHRFPDYTMTIWESIYEKGMLELFAPQCIDALGYENHLGESGANSAIFNGRAVPYVTRVMLAGGTNGVRWADHVLPIRRSTTAEKARYEELKKDVNIYRPEVRAAIEEGFADRVRRPVKYGVSCWNLGDECHFGDDIGFGDERDDGYFREFLKKRYGTIERYNAAHGTKLSSFDGAEHKLTAVSRKEGDWPSWGDQKAYAEKMYSDTFQLLRSVIKKFDPKARVGAEGSVPGDLEQTVADLEFWGPYRSLVNDELLRNIAPDRVRGIWWGGYTSEARNGFPENQWEYLLTGTLNGDLWFAASPGGTLSAFAGDFTPAPYVQKMMPHHSRLKRGLAPLLIRTPLRAQPFAFYYSHPSLLASTLSVDFPPPSAGLISYIRFCYRYGFDVSMVTPRTLGKLAGKKMLFLVGACSLSDPEIAAMKAFRAKGGEIVSDSEPGVLDEFFARRAAPPLKGEWRLLKRGWKDGELKAVLASKGIVQKEYVGGLDLEHTILRVRELGGMKIVGVKTRAKFTGSPAVIGFGGRGFIYECDNGFVREGDKVEIAALDRPFKLYAIFPEKQSPPVVAAAKTRIRPGDNVEIATSGLRRSGVYRLTVKDPDGAEIRNRERVFAADGKPLVFQFPYSDREGAYTVELRDIATGLTGSRGITLGGGDAAAKGEAAVLKINTSAPGHEIPKLLWGAFYEDYGFGADGGLYPELVANRGFDLPPAPLWAWEEDFRGMPARISVQHGRPVHPNTAAHVRIEAFRGKPGSRAGVRNTGYFGIAVKKGAEYTFSMYVRGLDGYRGDVEVLLHKDGRTLAAAKFPAASFKVGPERSGPDFVLPEWTRVTAAMTPSETAADAGLSVLLTDGGVIEADMVSLYPKDTFRGRANGLRRDLAEMVAAQKPAFLRFPGGCMLEGRDFQQWCDWKRTVGPLERRECIEGLWSWSATHGLGYYEYLLMCEDMGMEPMPVLLGAVTCQYRDPKYCPPEGLGYFIGNTLDLIEFMNGDASTVWGKVRASMGHPKPFNVKMIQIGNENWGERFLANFDAIAAAVKAKHPGIDVIGSAGGGVDNDGWRLAMKHFAGRRDLTIDEHYYMPADWFYENAGRYDGYDRGGPKIFVGEYASFDRVRGKPRCCLDNALGEAALMTGIERNSDIVVKASFAPMFLRSVDGVKEFFGGRKYSSAWPGSEIWFDGLNVVGRTSYYVQKMFLLNRPDALIRHEQNLPRTKDGVFAVCGLDRAKGEYVVKVVNPAGLARKLKLEFDARLPSGGITFETLSHENPLAENSLERPSVVRPETGGTAFAGGAEWETTLKPHSLAVYRLPAAK